MEQSFVIKWVSFILMLLLLGCATTTAKQKAPVSTGLRKAESQQEAESALRAVVGSLTGENMSEEELRKISREVKKDQAAQSAIQSLTENFSGAPGEIKYCPRDGKRYSSKLEKCPEHQLELKVLTE